MFKIDYCSKILLAVYLIFSVLFLASGIVVFDLTFILSWLLGVFSIIIFFRLLNLAFYFSSNMRFLVNLVFSMLSAGAMAYHYRAGSGIDFALTIDNIPELIYWESTLAVFSVFSNWDKLFLLLLAVFLLLSQILKKKLSGTDEGRLPYLKLMPLLLVYCGIILTPFPSGDDLTSLFQQGIDYYNYSEKQILSKKYQQKNEPFPFAKQDKKKKPKETPHIILLALESFNANFIEAETESGQKVTPFFNSLISKGYYLDNFFSGSIQTGKGHFSILCSLPPLTQGKAMTRFSDNNFRCLPQILKDFGYRTIFFQGNERVNFDNTYNFVKKNGIEQFVTTDPEVYPPKLLDEIKWGWGIQDNYLYQQALSRMDLLVSQKKPVFMMLATISHHMRFDSIPDEQKILFPDDKGDPRKKFMNSIRLSDEYLKTFIRELKKRPYYKNTLVIITGDHGFPAGEHGNYFPETRAYQESFRIPLLLLWPEKLPTFRDREHAFSQVDIGPTILDILGAKTPHHQLGTSVLNTRKGRYQYLVQPYDGVYLGVVKYPYKYLYHVRSGRESLVNLEDDPAELKNLIKSKKELLRELRAEKSLLWFNDQLMHQNRIFPL